MLRPSSSTPASRGAFLQDPHPFQRSAPGASRLARALARAALGFTLGVAAAGCAGRDKPPVAPTAEGPVTPVDVTDAKFAASVHELLRDGRRTPARDGLLVGTVRRQMAHASAQFTKGDGERGAESALGALYLVRKGEGRAEMIDAEGAHALRGLITRLGARGDEGRAAALMQMRKAALPPGSPEAADLDVHLAAIARWMQDTRAKGPGQALGDAVRVAIARSYVDATEASVLAAERAVDAWIGRAIEYNMSFRETGERPSREEAIEAARALETGGVTLACIYLRHGDARGAFAAIQRTSAKRVVRPTFFERLSSAAELDGAREWQALVVSLLQGEYHEPSDSFDVDPDVMEGALWGATLEAYRRDPGDLGVAGRVARTMVDLGMPEVAPLVLADGMGVEPAPVELAMGLRHVVVTLDREATDIDGARRLFQASGRLLALADGPGLRGRVEPSAAAVRSFMASVELRAGDLAGARALLQAALAVEPSAGGYTQLATVERQAGDAGAAAANIAKAHAAPDARKALVDVAEADLLAFEIHREAGAVAGAKQALEASLRGVLTARGKASSSLEKARAERLLGRVLDGYGDTQGASRALARAIDLSSNDPPELAASMRDAVGRALVRRDVAAARSALQRGLDAGLDREDLVYGGLWLRMLERDLGVSADGTAERALATAERPSWTAKLAAWANGKLSDADLGTAAQSPAQRVEAKFYAALAGKSAGSKAAEADLRDVSQSPVIDLLEVQLAREILAPAMRAELPGNVSIP